jgi:hypothetical protein
MELLSAGKWRRFEFADIARWPRPIWFWRRLRNLGYRLAWLPVADRDWFYNNEGKFFRFYTAPPITIHMPANSPKVYAESHFRRIQDVLAVGGFHTFDLG